MLKIWAKIANFQPLTKKFCAYWQNSWNFFLFRFNSFLVFFGFFATFTSFCLFCHFYLLYLFYLFYLFLPLLPLLPHPIVLGKILRISKFKSISNKFWRCAKFQNAQTNFKRQLFLISIDICGKWNFCSSNRRPNQSHFWQFAFATKTKSFKFLNF